MGNKAATSETIKHYLQPEIRDLLTRFSQAGQYYRDANGDTYGWYHNGQYMKPNDDEKYLINPATKAGYDYIVTQFRVLYTTLNFYDEDFFKLNFADITSTGRTELSKKYMRGLTVGLDIDTKNTEGMHGLNIRDPNVKRAVEAMAQYVVNHLKKWVPNSVYVLFSGGGIYVLIHHGCFAEFFNEYGAGKDGMSFEQWFFGVFRVAVNSFLGDIVKRFYDEYPQYEPYVKGDLINSSRRVFKAPYSIHRVHDYAVIPLNPDSIEIVFDDAIIPLRKDIIERAGDWYSTYDRESSLYGYLKSEYFKPAETKARIYKYRIQDNELEISQVPIRDGWPPCINNILNFPHNCEGITRSLFLLASFLGQAGIPEDEAKEIFYGLAKRTGAATTNIFDSAYRKMHCPSCEKLRSRDNTAFPSGVSIRITGACKPDSQCTARGVYSPAMYVNRELRHDKQLTSLSMCETIRVKRDEVTP